MSASTWSETRTAPRFDYYEVRMGRIIKGHFNWKMRKSRIYILECCYLQCFPIEVLRQSSVWQNAILRIALSLHWRISGMLTGKKSMQRKCREELKGGYASAANRPLSDQDEKSTLASDNQNSCFANVMAISSSIAVIPELEPR